MFLQTRHLHPQLVLALEGWAWAALFQLLGPQTGPRNTERWQVRKQTMLERQQWRSNLDHIDNF